jgi:cysteine-rich repeat protein
VEGVSPDFGGTSSDCPPTAGQFNSSLAIRFREVTTGTSTRTAGLPCITFGFTANPSFPTNTCLRGSEPGTSCATNTDCAGGGTCNKPVCTDTKTACTSNADCMRCTEDDTTVCTSNTQCAGKGSCAEAPDQPVTCGYWCNCGLCATAALPGGDPAFPCFAAEDCPVGSACIAPAGSGTQANAPQTKNNNCSGDKFICGGDVTEKCNNTFQGTCSDAGYRTCDTNADCDTFAAGTCEIDRRSCFETRITRTGKPSPLGTYCAFEDKTCTSNADCTQQGDMCVVDSSRPTTVALFCVPTSASSAVNSAGGIMGPGAVSLNSLLQVCRCGDGVKGCDEQCDDHNVVNGDGCDDLCQTEP